jgi:mannose-6-phosphate isomerase-like protein (cupin superfamily)
MTVFHANAMQLARDNVCFQKVLTTGAMQLLVLSLQPHEDLGAATQPCDQAYWIAAGDGELFFDGGYERVSAGDLIVVPADEWHNLANTTDKPMKALALSAPPLLPPHTTHRTKGEAHHRHPQPA